MIKFSEQLKHYFFTEATEARADIEHFRTEMQETKQKAQKEGISLEQIESLSIYAQILEIGVSVSLKALQVYEEELNRIEQAPARYDQLNPIAWAQGVAKGQREVEKWLKAA